MSGGLCPSKSTVYVGNLPYSLTNNDIHKLLEKYGRVVKVTIVKDKTTHKSTGVAFVLFLKKEDAHTCVRALSGTQLFGRTLKCNIAKDNGRAAEFIRRKVYKDKSRCYECGEYGHLSYYCPQNMLGDREPEKKKKKKRFHRSGTAEYGGEDEGSEEEDDPEEEGEDPSLESLSAAIRYQQEKMEQEEQARMNSGHCNDSSNTCVKKKRFKKSEYFSDEEEEIDDT